jgi:Subtilase family
VSPPVISAEARAADAAFLAFAPPPQSPGAMCLVDTGVNPNADTTPVLAYATSLDGRGSGDTDPAGHGTLMATLAGGQGHGLRGIWPAIKIVSVRAASTPPPGQSPTYQYANYVEALQKCLTHQPVVVKTVNLSLSSTIPPTPDQAQAFAQLVDELVARGIAIVAAAGNTPGKVQYPGSEPGVLSVGAGTLAGGVCSFSATERVGIIAPGCELDFADPSTDEYEPGEYAQGTSDASDITDTSLTALMTYDQQLTVAQAENLLVTTASPGGHLNVAGAFEAAGLGSIVAAGNAAIPPESSTSGPPKGPLATPLSPPRATIHSLSWKRGVLTLRLRGLPKGDRVHIEIFGGHRKTRQVAGGNTILRVRCSRPGQVRVWLTAGTTPGPVSTIRLGTHATGHLRTHRHRQTKARS